jgi:predicted nucleic-acid-binding protein
MTAVDTNVVVRLLAADHPKQAAAAKALFAAGPIWIAKTVLLETNWVLRGVYGFDEAAVCDAFTKLLGLRNVHTEDKPSLVAALALAPHRIDLADAIHLTGTPPGTAFVSFVQSLIRRAKRAGVPDASVLS